MKNRRRKILVSLTAVFAAAGTAYALISGSFSIPVSVLQSNGGGRLSSSGMDNITSVGQNISGSSSSSNYRTGTGFISNVTASSSQRTSPDLEKAYVYPNPYKPGSGGRYDADYLTFSNLTRQVKIEIFNIAGELVASVDKETAGNELNWIPENNAGEKLASGVYIFYLSNDAGDEKTGKFAIVK